EAASTSGVAAPPPAPPEDVRVRIEPTFAALGFDQPLAAMQAPGDDSRWFVVERTGRVYVFDNDPMTTTRALFADLTGTIFIGAPEAGLLGMAFHPDFSNNGQVFLSFTTSGAPLVSNVVRYTVTAGGLAIDPASAQTVLTVLQDFTNHNGGHLAFGQDGFLYIGMGDGGSANDPNDRAQTDSTLLGKLLRIDVDSATPYAIPADNPFAGNANCVQGFGGAACPEIFALGFRNPWRFSIDRGTGDIWLGDVGQNRFEEIDVVVAGGNYGWRIREGDQCQTPPSGCPTAGLTDPVHVYGRAEGVSVTGGFVYRGTDIPVLVGQYVFGDFGSGRIFAIPNDATLATPAEDLADTALSISSFAEGNDGELLVIDFGGGGLHRIVPDT
ncbi:MAG: PQQ-dependent sugar dehydrogenase, partial [Pseudomonadota bacterium]